MISLKSVNTTQRGRALWPPHLRRLLMMGCSGLVLLFILVNTAYSENFYRLNEAIPGQFVKDLAPVFDFDTDSCLPSAFISRDGEKNPGFEPYNYFLTPTIVSWDYMIGDNISNEEMRTKLNNFSYGKASSDVRDDRF